MNSKSIPTGILKTLLAAGLLAAQLASAQTTFQAILTGANEVPPNASPAQGMGLVTLNAAQTQITVNLSWVGLTAQATAAHIHGPAAAGANAGVMFPFSGVPPLVNSSIPQQTFAITPTQVGYLFAGTLYMNVHSPTFPGGEIRGQLFLPNVAPTNIVLLGDNIPENLPTNSLVGTFAAQDPNAGNTHTFTLVSGAGDDDNAAFAIVGTNLVTAAVLDYEVKVNYSIRVQAQDNGGLTYQKQFTIELLDDGKQLPVLQNISRAVPRNGQLDLYLPDFTYPPYFLDPDNYYRQAFEMKITSLPAHGTLKYEDDSPVQVGDMFSDIVGSYNYHIIYTPAAGYYGADSFGWNAADWNGSDFYPIDFAATNAQVNILVATVDELNPPAKVGILGTDFASNGKFRRPADVAVSPVDGTVYVADTDNNRIQQFDSNGVFIRKWGSYGFGNGQFYFPQHIAVGDDGIVYVSDYYRIQKFSATGTFITNWNSGGTYGANFAVKGANVYVADTYNHRIRKFNTSGGAITNWGSYGTGNGQFRSPQGVAVDNAGNVYVADTDNARIQKFDAAGNYLAQWNYFLSSPRDIAYYGYWDMLLVSDGINIKLYSTTGASYGWFGSQGNGNSQFGGNDKGIGANNGVDWYVADTSNHRIQKFRYYSSYQSKWGVDYSVFGSLRSPWALARDPAGNILVSDMDNSSYASITRYTSNGVPVAKWGSFGSQMEFSQFTAPTALAVNSTGLVYVADSSAGNLGIFNTAGTNLNVWNFYGTFNSKLVVDGANKVYQTDPNDGVIYLVDDGGNRTSLINMNDFAPPVSPNGSPLLRGLCVDGSNTLWTIDANNYTIFQFNTNGTLIQQWFGFDPAYGIIYEPLAIAVDATRGRVYIADNSGNGISCFTTSGAFLCYFGNETNPNFNDLLVDPAGMLYASDYNNGQVVKFKPNKTVYDVNLYTGFPPVLETNKPTISFTTPKNNLLTNLTGVTVALKATDNVWVQDVYLSQNNGPFAALTLASNGPTVNFSGYYALRPGPNTFQAYTRDAAGNISPTNTLYVFRVVKSTLHVATNGSGGIIATASSFGTPTNLAMLQIGRAYTLTAAFGSNYIFSNWLASVNGGPVVVATNTAKYTFLMQTNLTLTAQFVPNRFLDAAGSYNGLFWDTNHGVAYASAGFANVKVTAKQGKLATFSASLSFAGEKRSSSGTLDLTGRGAGKKPFFLKTDTNTLYQLYLTLPPEGPMTGVLSNLNGSWSAVLSADKAESVTNLAGRYTMVLPGSLDPAVAPGGDGYGLVSVDTNGTVKLTGALGDGVAISQKVPVSETGDWPLYAAVYTTTNNDVKVKGGILLGWLNVSNRLTGTLYQIKTPVPGARYVNGFTNGFAPLTSAYTNRAVSTNRVIELTSGSNGVVVLSGGDLFPALTNLISLSTLNKFTAPATNTAGGTNKLTLAVDVKTGKLTGSFKTNGVTATAITGVVLQNTNLGRGYFLGATNSGAFRLQGR